MLDIGPMWKNLHQPEVAEQWHLTDRQREVLKLFFDKNLTSSEVAQKLDVSTQSASTQLNRLNKKLYLKRQVCGDATGGIYYEYRLHDALRP